jgi:hypothetical protein
MKHADESEAGTANDYDDAASARAGRSLTHLEAHPTCTGKAAIHPDGTLCPRWPSHHAFLFTAVW